MNHFIYGIVGGVIIMIGFIIILLLMAREHYKNGNEGGIAFFLVFMSPLLLLGAEKILHHFHISVSQFGTGAFLTIVVLSIVGLGIMFKFSDCDMGPTSYYQQNGDYE